MVLDPKEQAIVDDEVGMSERVAKRVALSLAQQSDEKKPIVRAGLDSALMALRDDIAEAKNEDVAPLLAEMMRTAGVAAVNLPKAQGSVDPQVPYFGHLRLEEGGRKRDVLIGRRGMIDREAGVVIVDWRNAPVSRIYYRYDEEDDYEEELGDQVREGTVLVRRTVSFQRGRLMRIRCPAGTFAKTKVAATATATAGVDDASHATQSEAWVALAPAAVPELRGGVGMAVRAPADGSRRLGRGDVQLRDDKHLPEITALIDPKQFDAMTTATSGLVILQGGAGSGKTTIALHRVAWLVFEDAERFRPRHILVVVAQRQLVRYIERLLPSLDVDGVKVMAYGDWTRAAVQRMLGKRMRRVVDDVPGDVARVKKHPAMLTAIRRQVEARAAAADADIAAAVADRSDGADVVARFRARHAEPLLVRLEAFLEGDLRDGTLSEDTRERARRPALRARDQLADLDSEWEELISDAGLMSDVAADINDPSVMSTFQSHIKRQLEDEEHLADVDAERRDPVDDAIDPDDPLKAFDVHDLPLLLAMQLTRRGALVDHNGGPIAHDHIVVDEAQDLSALEIAPLVGAAGDRQSITLAGDVVQKVVFDNGYETWEELEGQLDWLQRRRALAVEPLQLSYRSTAEVVAFAREVLGPLAPAVVPKAVRAGAPVEVFSFVDTGEEVAFLADNLRVLMAREPQASCAVLLRYPERARFFYERLADAEVPRLRLVLPGDGGDVADDEFSFAPGIDITTVAKVKGLEYDYVVLVEVTEAMYPDAVAARHLLHIGATRAAHQLWVTTSLETPSPLLPTERIREI
jgi:DNA helicase-2/ATP-dependent DNA helicase PcrA